MTLLELLWTFFYIGLFTIGGGQVAITLMYEPLVGGGILSGEQFYNMVAVSESTPGPIGINMATYVGCELYGVIGGILVTLATVLPSLVIILVIAKFFDKYQEKPIVKSVFTCIRPVSAGLIAVAAYEVLKIAIIQPFSFVRLAIFLGAFALLMIKKISPVFVMILGAIAGILLL